MRASFSSLKFTASAATASAPVSCKVWIKITEPDWLDFLCGMLLRFSVSDRAEDNGRGKPTLSEAFWRVTEDGL